MVKPQNSLEQNHKKCYSTDHIECYSEPQKMLEQKWPQKLCEGRPHHKKWGILINSLCGVYDRWECTMSIKDEKDNRCVEILILVNFW